MEEKAGQPNGRECTKCKVWKVWGEFHKHADMKNGYSPCCKVCANARSAARYATPEVKAKKAAHYATPEGKAKKAVYNAAHYATPEVKAYHKALNATPERKAKVRERYLRNKFGLEPEQSAILWAYCQNSCYLCGKPENGRKMHIDHNHAFVDGDVRGVRGILCHDCNTFVLKLFELDKNSYLLSKFSPSFISKVHNYLADPPAQKLLGISA